MSEQMVRHSQTEFGHIMQRSLRVLPSFAITSLVGCFFARFVMDVPPNQVAIVVAIPLVVLFAMSRLFWIFLPPIPPEARRQEPPKHFVVFVVAFCCIFACIDLFFAALLYPHFGVSEEVTFLVWRFAGGAGIVAIICFVIEVLITMNPLIADISMDMLNGSWEIMSTPRRLADRVFPHARRYNC